MESTFEMLFERYKRPHITFADCATYLNMKPGTLDNRIREGRITLGTFKVGRTRWVDLRDLAAYMDARRDEAVVG